MGKKLNEMTREELWQLFPIILTEHDARWDTWYAEEREQLSRQLPAGAIINHIGSTAIKAICAKPTVDILVEVGPNEMSAADAAVRDSGYICMHTDTARMDYNKGYTENGFAERVFHLHLRVYGDCDELYFRDYLNRHAEVAREYEALKLSLWKRYEHDRDGYTDSKGDFVRKWTEIAKDAEKNRGRRV